MPLNLRPSIEALLAELKRLRAEGVDSVYLEAQTLAALREYAKSREAEGFTDLLAREFGGKDAAAKRGDATGEAGRDAAAGAGAQADETAATGAKRRRSEFSDGSEEFLATVAKAQAAEKSPQAVEAVSGANSRAAGNKGDKAAAQGLPAGVKPIPEPVPFELPEGDKQAQWNWLLEKVQTDTVCLEHLCRGKKLVLGTGSLDAEIFFCGEAPGQEEEEEGEPFVGPAGQLLTKIIQAMGLKRSDVYIGNIMNWRPEHDKPYGNRTPVEAEIRYCLPHLLAQLQIVRPKVIVALGLTAVNGLLGADPNRRIGSVRGRWLEAGGYPLMATYHPSYLLRSGTLSSKRAVWEDIMQVMEKTGMPISDKQRMFFTKA